MLRPAVWWRLLHARRRRWRLAHHEGRHRHRCSRRPRSRGAHRAEGRQGGQGADRLQARRCRARQSGARLQRGGIADRRPREAHQTFQVREPSPVPESGSKHSRMPAFADAHGEGVALGILFCACPFLGACGVAEVHVGGRPELQPQLCTHHGDGSTDQPGRAAPTRPASCPSASRAPS